MKKQINNSKYVPDVALPFQPKSSLDITLSTEAVTCAPTARLARYAIPRKEKAIIHVTAVDTEKKEIAVADVWRLPPGYDITKFDAEAVAVAAMLVEDSHPLKRKPEDFDLTLQGLLSRKKIHRAFGEPAVEETK